MSYQVVILRRAVKELARLPQSERLRIERDIEALAGDPRPLGSRKLSGRDGYRIRSGHYRVIYEMDDPLQSVTILHVGHRRDIYR